MGRRAIQSRPALRAGSRLFGFALLVAAMAGASYAEDEDEGFGAKVKERWENGHWRLEISTLWGLDQGRRGREGDFNFNVVVEKELELYKRLTISARFQPIFLYDESGGDTIFGAGFGFALRVYSHRERRGFFGEASLTPILQSDKFEGNSTIFNFQSEFGIGYKFKKNWHVVAQWRHLSNASLGSENAGVNGVGLGVGYTF